MQKISSFLMMISGLRVLRSPTFTSLLNRSTPCASSIRHLASGTNPVSQKQDSDINNEHFKLSRVTHPLGDKGPKKVEYWDNPVPHTIYTKEELLDIPQTHHCPGKIKDGVALIAVRLVRFGFDFVSRYKGPGGQMTSGSWLNRCIFLETLAGVPGMVAGTCRHLKSLRSMQRDYGWIHTLLAEAENERMHLLIFVGLKENNIFLRALIIIGQGVFYNSFFLTYLLSPQACHRFVGYLEEEAVKTYTGLLEDLGPNGHLRAWGDEPATEIARKYYKLPDDACFRDVVMCVRADEANHRDVNHTLANLDPTHTNPFIEKKV